MVRTRRRRIHTTQLCDIRRYIDNSIGKDKQNNYPVMKTVIIGGGIAGMAAGSFLDRNGMEIVICERQAGKCQGGHAFLMHSEALSILNELNAGRESLLPG